MAVRFSVYALRCFLVRCVHKAKGCPAPLIEPVGQELDPVRVLHGQVFDVGLRDLGLRSSLHIVAIKEDRHAAPRVSPSNSFMHGCARRARDQVCDTGNTVTGRQSLSEAPTAPLANAPWAL